MAGAGKVIIVTGASRGVGYGIGKELALRLPGASLYLTSRSTQHHLTELDNNLKREIGAASDNARFRHIDVKDQRSIKKFFEMVKRKHNRIDIIINNAAKYNKPPASIHGKCPDLPLFLREVEETTKTNYFGLKSVIEASTPVLAPDARIINMTSHLANFKIFNDADPVSVQLKQSFQDPKLTVEKLDSLLKKYVQDIKSKPWGTSGWPKCSYSVTKLAVNCYTRLLQVSSVRTVFKLVTFLQEEFNRSRPRHGIKVNAVCPGTSHSKMRLPRDETISVADSADVIGNLGVRKKDTQGYIAGYLATMNMVGLGDCTIPYEEVPQGQVLWHDLSTFKEAEGDSIIEDQDVVQTVSN